MEMTHKQMIAYSSRMMFDPDKPKYTHKVDAPFTKRRRDCEDMVEAKKLRKEYEL